MLTLLDSHVTVLGPEFTSPKYQTFILVCFDYCHTRLTRCCVLFTLLGPSPKIMHINKNFFCLRVSGDMSMLQSGASPALRSWLWPRLAATDCTARAPISARPAHNRCTSQSVFAQLLFQNNRALTLFLIF